MPLNTCLFCARDMPSRCRGFIYLSVEITIAKQPSVWLLFYCLPNSVSTSPLFLSIYQQENSIFLLDFFWILFPLVANNKAEPFSGNVCAMDSSRTIESGEVNGGVKLKLRTKDEKLANTQI